MENVNREMLRKKTLDLASGEKDDNLTFHISEYIGDELENPVAIEWSNVNSFTCSKLVPGEVKVRYQFCEYLIDPNKFRLQKVLRILALVKKILRALIKRVKSVGHTCKLLMDSELDIRLPEEVKGRTYVVMRSALYDAGSEFTLTDEDVKDALMYFYRLSTLDIKQFKDKRVYENISVEISGILHYKGRILQGILEERVCVM